MTKPWLTITIGQFYSQSIIITIWFAIKLHSNAAKAEKSVFKQPDNHLLISELWHFVLLLCADAKASVESSKLTASAAGAESRSPVRSSDGSTAVKRHKAREHKRVYRCSLCNKVFQNSSNLNRHIRSHGTDYNPIDQEAFQGLIVAWQPSNFWILFSLFPKVTNCISVTSATSCSVVRKAWSSTSPTSTARTWFVSLGPVKFSSS